MRSVEEVETRPAGAKAVAVARRAANTARRNIIFLFSGGKEVIIRARKERRLDYKQVINDRSTSLLSTELKAAKTTL